MKRAIIPEAFKEAAAQIQLSPAMLSNGHVFVSGTTGSLPDGTMPNDPEAQFASAFEKIASVLAQVGLSLADTVELTTYHIDIDAHFETFSAVHRKFLSAPYPAWTAVEVAKLRRKGALVEIRLIANAADLDASFPQNP